MNLEGLEVENTSTTGFSVLAEKALLSKILQSPDFCAPGDFVFTVSGRLYQEKITLIYSTEVAAIPWYYTCSRNQLYHGQNVFDVWKKSGAEWEWNQTALYAINNLDHSVDDLTIHKLIKRVPANSTLIFFKNELTILKRKESLLAVQKKVSIEEGIHNFKLLLKDYFSDTHKNYFLSLSAGFDSRLLLASMLHFNIRPSLATMGNEDTTDVRIASAIAKDLGLQHEHFVLNKNDYFDPKKINKIIELTSGTKPMRHWHTYFFIEHFKNLPNTTHFAGSNGEVIRSYYFDKGMLSKLLNYSGNYGFEFAINQKLKRGDQVVIESLKEPEYKKEVQQIFFNEAPELSFMQRLAFSYCKERVRHFTGKGLALYNACLPTISPFLDTRFLEIKASLENKFTLNNLFHKHCIRQLYPDLMKYPFSENSKDICDVNSNTYFLKKLLYKDYNMAHVLLKEEAVKNIIFESRFLDSWINSKQRTAIWNQQNERTISFLVTLHHTAALIESRK